MGMQKLSASKSGITAQKEFVSFEDFLQYVRVHIGDYCTDKYWEFKWKTLKELSYDQIISQMPYLAANAIGTDYATKNP